MTIIGNRARNCSLWMLKQSEKQNDSITKIKAEKLFGLRDDQFIICSNCSNGITAPDKIITVNDRHCHTFSNPAGFTFEIGCFSSAEGCIVHGEPTSDNTWFAGFSWNYALCSKCLGHLGWFYQNKNSYFFGLILDLLVDTTTTQ